MFESLSRINLTKLKNDLHWEIYELQIFIEHGLVPRDISSRLIREPRKQTSISTLYRQMAFFNPLEKWIRLCYNNRPLYPYVFGVVDSESGVCLPH